MDNIATAPCPQCQRVGELSIEWRTKLQARPLGAFSLSGAQMKFSAHEIQVPILHCANCGLELEGERANDNLAP